MKKVIFVCHGNMLRSQMAEAIYNHLAKDGSVSESYGTSVFELGVEGMLLSSIPRLSTEIEFLKDKGMDISKIPCRQVTPETLKDASKIILMAKLDPGQEWINNYPYEYWEVPNPEEHTPETLKEVYDTLYPKILELLNTK
jgi:protein-tyrosine-phosphatase